MLTVNLECNMLHCDLTSSRTNIKYTSTVNSSIVCSRMCTAWTMDCIENKNKQECCFLVLVFDCVLSANTYVLSVHVICLFDLLP